ncbi:zinc metalloprotease [Mycobacterium sp. 852013-50091_SCH5140682]|nr:zinc metalloprotease [Mycobacterium sp. 852013-50091_SCH5140682]
MTDGIPIARVYGIPVSIHWSVVVVLWLFTWSLASLLPGVAGGHSEAAYWLAGLCGAMVLVASLLAHEATHAIVARRNGIEVKGLKLWLLGGVARLGSEPKTPRTDFLVAVAGPMTSLVLAGAFAGIAAILRYTGAADLVVGVSWWLAGINLVLGLFNLVPGAPLDGGRILRAFLWRKWGDPMRAAVGAARAGRGVGYSLIGVGLLQFFAGAVVGGVWTAFIGWFLLTAAREEEATVRVRQALAGLTVADVMTTNPHTVPAGISVDDFIRDYLLGDRHSAYPIKRPDGTICGLITLEQLRSLASSERTSTLVEDAAIPLAQVPIAGPDEPVTVLPERLDSPTGHRVLVMRDGTHAVGIVTARDIARLLDVRRLISKPFL